MKEIPRCVRMLAALAATVCCGGARAGSAAWTVTVDPSVEIGPVKPVNAVNCGPTAPFGSEGNFRCYKAARIPLARTHDMYHCWSYGGHHAMDVSAIFPNFDADETKPESYDFTRTDAALSWMVAAGTEPFFRLGESIEPWAKKYNVHPPKDFSKWARVCERIIAHYTEGWADGKRWRIRYWEIWNEPNIGAMWTGTKAQFLEFYKVSARHLKARFPHLMIGGPAMAGSLPWKEDFIPMCQRERVPLDFYSWHGYCADARHPSREAKLVRAWLDAHGFAKTESVYDEWNYVKGWGGSEWRYSREVESTRFNQKGAAYVAAMMAECQNAPIDLAMYYDVRTFGGMNALFESITQRPMRGYYPFYAWGRLRAEYPTQVKCTLSDAAAKDAQLFAVAAKGRDGAVALFLARYSDDNNVVDEREVRLALPKGRLARCHLTDDVRIFTEVPLEASADGSAALILGPNASAFVEVER